MVEELAGGVGEASRSGILVLCLKQVRCKYNQKQKMSLKKETTLICPSSINFTVVFFCSKEWRIRLINSCTDELTGMVTLQSGVLQT